jgi:hypothetical protein
VTQALKTDPTGELAKMTEDIGMSVEVACGMLADVIDKSTRETHGGEFLFVDGSKLPW